MQVEYCNMKHYSKYTVLQYSAHCWITYLFCLRNVWMIEDTVVLPTFGCTLRPASAIVRPWLRTWSTIVALISWGTCLCPWPLLPLPLFCLPTLPPRSLTPLLLPGCWPCSFPCCSSIVRNRNTVLCSVYICLPIEGSWDAPLSYFRELVDHWLI